MKRLYLFFPVLAAVSFGQSVDIAFFEAKIRPVLAGKCYGDCPDRR